MDPLNLLGRDPLPPNRARHSAERVTYFGVYICDPLQIAI